MFKKGWICFLLLGLVGCSKTYMPLPTAQKVDLQKYQGAWYEIARLPNYFEKGCLQAKAHYVIKQDHIKVTNSCVMRNSGKTKTVIGKAWSKNSSNSKLQVQFFWPFKGDYWILYIDKDYQYALVGTPSREYLWILARHKQISAPVLETLITKAKGLGFEVNKLVIN